MERHKAADRKFKGEDLEKKMKWADEMEEKALQNMLKEGKEKKE